jgi:hypothetical protein
MQNILSNTTGNALRSKPMDDDFEDIRDELEIPRGINTPQEQTAQEQPIPTEAPQTAVEETSQPTPSPSIVSQVSSEVEPPVDLGTTSEEAQSVVDLFGSDEPVQDSIQQTDEAQAVLDLFATQEPEQATPITPTVEEEEKENSFLAGFKAEVGGVSRELAVAAIQKDKEAFKSTMEAFGFKPTEEDLYDVNSRENFYKKAMKADEYKGSIGYIAGQIVGEILDPLVFNRVFQAISLARNTVELTRGVAAMGAFAGADYYLDQTNKGYDPTTGQVVTAVALGGATQYGVHKVGEVIRKVKGVDGQKLTPDEAKELEVKFESERELLMSKDKKTAEVNSQIEDLDAQISVLKGYTNALLKDDSLSKSVLDKRVKESEKLFKRKEAERLSTELKIQAKKAKQEETVIKLQEAKDKLKESLATNKEIQKAKKLKGRRKAELDAFRERRTNANKTLREINKELPSLQNAMQSVFDTATAKGKPNAKSLSYLKTKVQAYNDVASTLPNSVLKQTDVIAKIEAKEFEAAAKEFNKVFNKDGMSEILNKDGKLASWYGQRVEAFEKTKANNPLSAPNVRLKKTDRIEKDIQAFELRASKYESEMFELSDTLDGNIKAVREAADRSKFVTKLRDDRLKLTEDAKKATDELDVKSTPINEEELYKWSSTFGGSAPMLEQVMKNIQKSGIKKQELENSLVEIAAAHQKSLDDMYNIQNITEPSLAKLYDAEDLSVGKIQTQNKKELMTLEAKIKTAEKSGDSQLVGKLKEAKEKMESDHAALESMAIEEMMNKAGMSMDSLINNVEKANLPSSIKQQALNTMVVASAGAAGGAMMCVGDIDCDMQEAAITGAAVLGIAKLGFDKIQKVTNKQMTGNDMLVGYEKALMSGSRAVAATAATKLPQYGKSASTYAHMMFHVPGSPVKHSTTVVERSETLRAEFVNRINKIREDYLVDPVKAGGTTNDKVNEEVRSALIGDIPFKDLSDTAKKAVVEIREVEKDLLAYLKSNGLEPQGKINADYFRRTYNEEKLINNKAVALAQMTKAMKEAAERGEYYAGIKDPEEAARRAYENILEGFESMGGKSVNLKSESLTAKSLMPKLSFLEERKLPAEVDTYMDDFLEGDIIQTMMRTVNQSVKTGEFTRAFGVDGKALDLILSKAGSTSNEKQAIVDNVAAYFNKLGHAGGNKSEQERLAMRKMYAYAQMATTLPKLGYAAITALADSSAIVWNSGIVNTLKAAKMRSTNPKLFNQVVEDFNAINAVTLERHMVQQEESISRAVAITDTYFRVTGLTGMTAYMRELATAAAVMDIKKVADKAAKIKKLPETDSRRIAFEVTAGDAGWVKNGKVDYESLAKYEGKDLKGILADDELVIGAINKVDRAVSKTVITHRFGQQLTYANIAPETLGGSLARSFFMIKGWAMAFAGNRLGGAARKISQGEGSVKQVAGFAGFMAATVMASELSSMVKGQDNIYQEGDRELQDALGQIPVNAAMSTTPMLAPAVRSTQEWDKSIPDALANSSAFLGTIINTYETTTSDKENKYEKLLYEFLPGGQRGKQMLKEEEALGEYGQESMEEEIGVSNFNM